MSEYSLKYWRIVGHLKGYYGMLGNAWGSMRVLEHPSGCWGILRYSRERDFGITVYVLSRAKMCGAL